MNTETPNISGEFQNVSLSGDIKSTETTTLSAEISGKSKVEEKKEDTSNIKVCKECKKEGWYKHYKFKDGEKSDKLCMTLQGFVHLECLPPIKKN